MKLKGQCPAAQVLDGPPAAGPAVICGVMVKRFDLIDSITGPSERGVLMTMRDAPHALGFCCGQDVPLLEPDEDARRAHYTCCDLWQADRILGWAEQEEPEPDSPSVREIVTGEAL